MSKVAILHTVARDTFPVTAATITTSWLPGQFFALTSTGEYAQIASTAGAYIGVAVDASTEVSAPPTGSLVTVAYGSGTRLQINHAAEVLASSAARVYTAEVPSQAPNSLLYCDAAGKWTYNGNGKSVTGSIAGVMVGVPAAYNSFTLDVIVK